MAKAEVGYLIGACCCGLLSLALIIVGYSTEAWVSAVVKPHGGGTDQADVSHANHGLFAGTYNRRILGSVKDYTIYATCLIEDNVCAWSCIATEDGRRKELEQLYQTGLGFFNCDPIAASLDNIRSAINPIDSNQFMSAGLWIATIVFLTGALAFNLAAFALNAYNVFYNPIEAYATPMAVIIAYGVAACSTLLTLILWGAQFGAYTLNNIAVLDTLTKELESEASLDWSYYILIPAEISQLAAAGVVYYRDYKIRKQDADKVLKTAVVESDLNTGLY